MIPLRPYQQELVDNIRRAIGQGRHSVCAVLGCGGGKSVIQGNIAASATARGNRVLFVVHRKELCQQITNTFTACGVDFSLYRRHGTDGLSQVGKDSGAEADSGRRSTSYPVAELFVHPAAFSGRCGLRLYRHAAAHERGWSGSRI